MHCARCALRTKHFSRSLQESAINWRELVLRKVNLSPRLTTLSAISLKKVEQIKVVV